MKIFEASRHLAKLTAQFTAAGLNIEDFIKAEDDTALKAYLASLVPAAVVATDTKKIEAVEARIVLLTQALATAGIQLKASDEAKGLQASDIQTAIDTRISLKAAELAAQQGTKPVDTDVKPNAAAPKKGEMTFAAFKQLSDHARCEFMRQGGRLNS